MIYNNIIKSIPESNNFTYVLELFQLKHKKELQKELKRINNQLQKEGVKNNKTILKSCINLKIDILNTIKQYDLMEVKT